MTPTEQADLIAFSLRNIADARAGFASLPEHRKEAERAAMQRAFYAVGRELLDVVTSGTEEDLLRIASKFREVPGPATEE